MSDAASSGQVSHAAARGYESSYVPALFGEWAPRVADAADIRPGQRVLDVACGTGVVAREVARRIGADAVVGLDCNPGMLAVAAEICPGIDWQEADVTTLPDSVGDFDAVVCQFGLMFFRDRTRALHNMWRVLRPGGRLVIAVWADLSDSPGYRAIVDLLGQVGAVEAADELRAPFSLGDAAVLRRQLQAAGIEDPSIETVVGRGRFPSVRAWIDADVEAWTLGPLIGDDALARLRARADEELRRFVAADGTVEFPSPAHLVRAVKA